MRRRVKIIADTEAEVINIRMSEEAMRVFLGAAFKAGSASCGINDADPDDAAAYVDSIIEAMYAEHAENDSLSSGSFDSHVKR